MCIALFVNTYNFFARHWSWIVIGLLLAGGTTLVSVGSAVGGLSVATRVALGIGGGVLDVMGVGYVAYKYRKNKKTQRERQFELGTLTVKGEINSLQKRTTETLAADNGNVMVQNGEEERSVTKFQTVHAGDESDSSSDVPQLPTESDDKCKSVGSDSGSSSSREADLQEEGQEYFREPSIISFIKPQGESFDPDACSDSFSEKVRQDYLKLQKYGPGLRFRSIKHRPTEKPKPSKDSDDSDLPFNTGLFEPDYEGVLTPAPAHARQRRRLVLEKLLQQI